MHTELTGNSWTWGQAGQDGRHLIRAWSTRLMIPLASSQMGRNSLGAPGEGEICHSNPPLIPGLCLRLEMAAAEPGSLGTPARRPWLPSASPVLPRDCDPGGLAQPAESWGLRAPGTPLPAQLRETVPTQVRSLWVEREAHRYVGVGVDG